MAFRREKFVPRGGPAGGDGGRGGDVVLVADVAKNTLEEFRHRQKFQADDGTAGGGSNRYGAAAEDLVIRIPVGTEVWEVRGRTAGGQERRVFLGDLVAADQRLRVAKGGRGGRGNLRFLGPGNQEPLLAEAGEAGERRRLRLELKLLADIGIVGMPNAGKSSLLVGLSAARAKVAAYPFTTLEPLLGVVSRGLDALVLVEIPGLVEGAAEGRGLGHEFLRHVQRTRLLLHVVDGTEPDVGDRIAVIDAELAAFDAALAERPQIVVINKVDLPELADRLEAVRREVGDAAAPRTRVLTVSAATHEGLDDLRDALFAGLAAVQRAEALAAAGPDEPEELPVLRPRPRRARAVVARENGGFRILHERALRVARGSDLERFEVQVQFHRFLEQVGVVRELENEGVKAGDTVWVGDRELEWS